MDLSKTITGLRTNGGKLSYAASLTNEAVAALEAVQPYVLHTADMPDVPTAKAETSPAVPAAAAKKAARRPVSPEARKRMAAAQRARWAKKKAPKKEQPRASQKTLTATAAKTASKTAKTKRAGAAKAIKTAKKKANAGATTKPPSILEQARMSEQNSRQHSAA